MPDMNVFQQLWKNWTHRADMYRDKWPEAERVWVNELNQAVFKRLENILPAHVKVRSVTAPAFLFHTEAAGGYGVDARSGCVHSYRTMLPNGSFEERVEHVVDWLSRLATGAETVFFYMPIYPDGNDVGSETYRNHVFVRLLSVKEHTVDVKEPT